MLRLTDVHPPLYYWAAWAWSGLFGQGIVSVRLLSLVATLVAAVAVCVAAVPWGTMSRRIALVAFAIAPMATWSAVSARDYGLALCFVALALLAAQRALELEKSPKPIAIIGFGVAAGLAFLTHYFTLFAIIPAGLVLVIARSRTMPWAMITGVAIFLALFLISATYLQDQIGSRPSQTSGFTSAVPELNQLIRLQATLILDLKFTGLVRTALFLTALIFLIVVFAAALTRFVPDVRVRLHVVVLVGYWIGLFALYWATDKSLVKAGGVRYAVFALPSFCVLTAVAADVCRQRLHRLMPVAFLVALGAFGAVTWGVGRGPLQPWSNSYDISTLRNGLMDADPQTTAIVVPRGFGRGGPGRYAQAFAPETKMIVLASEDSPAPLLADLDTLDTVLLLASGRKERLEPETQTVIETALEQSGFRQGGDPRFWTRTPGP